MKQFDSNHFLLLHNGISLEQLKRFGQIMGEMPKSSTLARLLALLEARVPIPPRAFMLASSVESLNQKVNTEFLSHLNGLVSELEDLTQSQLGGRNKPLLLTVRGDYSGMIRNIGVCPTSLPSLLYFYGPEAAYGLYIDFLESYSKMVLGIQHIDFRKTFGLEKGRDQKKDHLKDETEDGFLQKVREYQNLISQKTGRPFSEKPEHHLLSTLVQCSRVAGKVQSDEIFIQTQYLRSNFGQSTHGVVYTRNPFTGDKDLYGVYQCGADGKKGTLDVETKSSIPKHGEGSLRAKFPSIYSEILRHLPKIEGSCHDVMEVNFVSDEDGHLYFTQFEKAESTARAAVVSTIELNRDGVISDKEAALRFKNADIEMLLHSSLDEASRLKLEDLGSSGVSAAPGTAVGHVFFRMEDAIQFYKDAVRTNSDKRTILISNELLISDTPGLGIISGLVTKASGIASHAAVMARANGIPCIVGYKGIELSPGSNSCQINGHTLKAGTLVTLEAGAVGRLYFGEGVLQNLSFKEGVIQNVSQLLTRVAKHENIPLEVRVNINNPKDAEVGLSFGASGVGLCRTENMFVDPKALREIRNVIFSSDVKKCTESFQILEEIQYQDFRKIFELMHNRVVNIRLMDLPLHDFAPQNVEDLEKVVQDLPHLSREEIVAKAEGLKEHNPMLGLRACRFGLIMPEIYDLQIRAIIRAAYSINAKVLPGIMFPLVLLETELRHLKKRVLEIEEQVRESLRVPVHSKLEVRVGSMIELPAAALGADKLARVGEFFAFGTNDLTQTTMGMSRDDSAHYLPFYLEKGYLATDPFKSLCEPVRELVESAVQRGRRVRPDASFGICGEQGGEPSTLEFCMNKGLNYVSCSPFRVLPVLLSVIQIALKRATSYEPSVSQTPSTSNRDGNGPSPKLAQAG